MDIISFKFKKTYMNVRFNNEHKDDVKNIYGIDHLIHFYDSEFFSF